MLIIQPNVVITICVAGPYLGELETSVFHLKAPLKVCD